LEQGGSGSMWLKYVGTGPLAMIASRSRCQLHRKRESQHHVTGGETLRIRLRY
jgi:hypothetical protein